MKRKTKLITIFILIMILTITLIYKINTPKTINKANEEKSNFISMMYEQEDGKYVKSSDRKWPIRSYVFNAEKSYCKNNSVLEWNNVSKKVKVKVKGTDKCYVYFDLEELGTEESPYKIRVIEDLVDLANEVNNGENYAGKVFRLEKDLDFTNPNDYEDANRTDFGDLNGTSGPEALIKELTTGSGFTPIGYDENYESGEVFTNYFKGNFDGGNHQIKNLHETTNPKKDIDKTDFLGLFGRIENATINNLTVTGNIEIEDRGIVDNVQTVNRSAAGGIVGLAMDGVNLINLTNYVNVYTTTARDSVGGILAQVSGSSHPEAMVTIKNCQNYGNISNSNQVGGIVGFNYGVLIVENCENYGVITNEKGTAAMGGLVGSVNANANLTMKNSNNRGIVTTGNSNASEQKMGGIVGNCHDYCYLENSNNYGEIQATIAPNNTSMNLNYGGILGRVSGKTTTIKNSHNYGLVSGEVMHGSGVVAQINSGGTLILDNVSNEAEVKCNNTNNSNKICAGLVSYINNGHAYILNSYNKGTISSIGYSYNGGLVGGFDSNANNTLNIINSYSQGNIIGERGYNGGITTIRFGYVNMNLNNVFFIGELSGSDIYGIGVDNTTHPYTINNVYISNSYQASNRQYSGTISGKSVTEMKQQAFVDELNQNIESINLENIDPLLKDYKLSKWTLGSDGYPTLINE